MEEEGFRPVSTEQLDQRDGEPDDAGRHDPQLPIQPRLQAADIGLDIGNLGSHLDDISFRFRLDVGDLRLLWPRIWRCRLWW